MNPEPPEETPADIIKRAKREVSGVSQDGGAYYWWTIGPETVEELRRGLERFPDSAELWSEAGIAVASMADRQRDGSVGAFWRATELDPDDLFSLFLLGAVLSRAEHPEDALDYLEEVVRRAPGHEHRWLERSARVELARVLLRLGNTEAARYQLEQAVSFDPGDPEAHAALGSLLLELGNVTRAALELQKALTCAATRFCSKWDQVRIRWTLARVFRQLGNLTGAREQLEKALAEARPLTWEPWQRVIPRLESALQELRT